MGFGSVFKGALGSGIGSLFGIGQAAASAKMQYRYAKKMAQNAPSWNVAGLRKAGLNPILAANPAGGSPSAGMPPVSPPDVAGSAANLSSAKLKSAQESVAKNQEKITWNQALSSASKAITDLRKQQWESKVYDYMNTKYGKKVMLPLSAIKMAGVNLSGAKTAAAVTAFMNSLEESMKYGKRPPRAFVPRKPGSKPGRPDPKKIKDRLKWR